MTQQPDGQTAGYAPGKWFPRLPLQCHMSLLAMACYEHFMHTGDERFAGDSLQAIMRMVEHWERYRDCSGLITDLHTVFVDWGSHIYSYGNGCKGPTGALTTMNAYYLGVLGKVQQMAEYLGQAAEARSLGEIADAVRAAIREHLFDSGTGLFRDGMGNPLAERNISQTANTLAVLYGAAPEGEAERIMRRIFTPDQDIIPANAHFAPKLLEALFESGCDDLAVKIIKNDFGRMLDVGAGTLWETWEPYASQCQGTGASIARHLSRYLTGVYPAEPGYGKIGISPHPAGLEQIRADLATPVGRIRVEWERLGAGLAYRLMLPDALLGRPIVAADGVELEVVQDNSV